MQIKKIVVDVKPKSCSECYFRGIPDKTVVPEIYSCDLFDCHGDMFESWDCPLEAESLFGTMREATYEEQASVNRYINSISKETGIDFVERQSEN